MSSDTMKYKMNGNTPLEGVHTQLAERKCKVLSSIEKDYKLKPNKRRVETNVRTNSSLPYRSRLDRFTKARPELGDVDVRIMSRQNGKSQYTDTVVSSNDSQIKSERHLAARNLDWQFVTRVEGMRFGCGDRKEYLIRWLEQSWDCSWVASVDCKCSQLIEQFYALVQNELEIVLTGHSQLPKACPPLHNKWSQRAYQKGHRWVFELHRGPYFHNRQRDLLNSNGSVPARPDFPRARRSVLPPDKSPVVPSPDDKTCACTTCLHIQRLSEQTLLKSPTPVRSNVVNRRRFDIILRNPRTGYGSISQFPKSNHSQLTRRAKSAPPSASYQLSFKTHGLSTERPYQPFIPILSNSKIRLDLGSVQSKASQQPSIDKVIGELSASKVPSGPQQREIKNRHQYYTSSKTSQSSQSSNESVFSSTSQESTVPDLSDYTYSPSPTCSLQESPPANPNKFSPNLNQRTRRFAERMNLARSVADREEQLSNSNQSRSLPTIWQRGNSSTSFEQTDIPTRNSRNRNFSLMIPPSSSLVSSPRQSSASAYDSISENGPMAAPVILPPDWRNRLRKKGKAHMIPEYEAAGARSGTPAPERFATQSSTHHPTFAAATAAQRGARAANNINHPIAHIPSRRDRKIAVRSHSRVQARENQDVDMQDAHANPSVKVHRAPLSPTPAQRMAQMGGVIGKNGVFVPLTSIEQRQVLLGQRALAIRMGLATRDELLDLLVPRK